MSTQTFDTSKIVVEARLRPLSESKAQLLAADISINGLHQPILLRPADETGNRILIAGHHRLRAFEINGDTAISFKEWKAKSRNKADQEREYRMVEIAENLIRADLTVLDRAIHVVQWKDDYEELYPEVKKGAQGGRGGKRNEKATVAFSKMAAEEWDVSESTIKRLVRCGRDIDPEVRALIAGTDLANKQKELETLGGLPKSQQKQAVEMVLRENDPLPTIAAAQKVIEGHVAVIHDKDEEAFKKLFKAWGKTATPAARRQFLSVLIEDENEKRQLLEFLKSKGVITADQVAA